MNRFEYKDKIVNLEEKMRKDCFRLMKEIVSVIGPNRFEVETDYLYDTMSESAYLMFCINDSGEYAYYRSEKVTGASLTNDLCIKTETGMSCNIKDIEGTELLNVLAFLEELSEDVSNGQLKYEDGVLCEPCDVDDTDSAMDLLEQHAKEHGLEGVEFTEEDANAVISVIASGKTAKEAADEVLSGIRRCLDDGLEI